MRSEVEKVDQVTRVRKITDENGRQILLALGDVDHISGIEYENQLIKKLRVDAKESFCCLGTNKKVNLDDLTGKINVQIRITNEFNWFAYGELSKEEEGLPRLELRYVSSN